MSSIRIRFAAAKHCHHKVPMAFDEFLTSHTFSHPKSNHFSSLAYVVCGVTMLMPVVVKDN
jgi:hypothetical protein